MNFSRRNKYALLVLLVILNIAFRIPTVLHELGVDSFKIHSYANVISSHGFANWIIHPLSVFGMYPFSTPSAVPFMQSGFSQLTGLNVEYTILLTSIIIGLIAIFTAYIMAKEIRDDDLFAFLVAFFFSLSPVFLSYTIWTTSTRHLFIALIPFFIWGLLRCYNRPQGRLKYIILTIVLFILLGTIHHMIVLLGFILIAYFGALILEHVKIKIKINVFDKKVDLVSLMIPFIWFSVCIVFIALQVYQLYFYKGFDIWWKYQSGFFFHGTDAQSLFMNMLVDYWSKIGILAVFGLFGLIIFFKKSKREFYQNFLLIALLIFAPILTWGWYVPLVLLSFFCVLLVYGMLGGINLKQIQKFASQLIIICLLISTVFSIFMLCNWDIQMPGQKADYLHDSDCNLGVYIKNHSTVDASFISNYRERMLSPVLELPNPPPDTAYIFDLLNESELGIYKSFSLSSLTHIDDPDAIYKTRINYRAEYRGQSNDVDSDSRKKYNSKYNIKYVVQHNMILGKIHTNRGIISERFYSSIVEKTPKIYDNGKLSTWYVGE